MRPAQLLKLPVLLLTTAIYATPANILLYTRTLGFRHDSISTAVDALTNRSSSINIHITHTEDPSMFNDETLSSYDAVVFLDNTAEVLDDSGTTAFQKYLDLGGNFVGIHAASDCLNTTTFYGQELGAYFDYHPFLQNATVVVLDNSHPSTQNIPTEWHVQDEIYNFKSDPRDVGAVVVLTVNESTYTDDGTRKYDQGNPHPIAWYQEHGAGVQSEGITGRSFYTSLGHLNETWKDDTFMGHVLGGIQWTLAGNTTKAFNSSAAVGNAAETSSSASSSTSGPSPSGTSEEGAGSAIIPAISVLGCLMIAVLASLS